jgi:tetratricopeptide (TPR) repeat protein
VELRAYFKTTSSVLKLAAVNLTILLGLLAVLELGSRFLEHGAHKPTSAETDVSEELQLPPKSSSELRVFMFGGSTVYGSPVPEVAFVSQTEYWLRQLFPDRNIKVYNFGSPGRDMRFVRNRFAHRLADRPDLAVVITGHNEFLQSTPRHTSIADLHAALSQHLATMRLVDRVVNQFRTARKAYVMPDRIVPRDRQSVSFASKVSSFEADFKDMIARAQQRGVKLIVGTLPANVADWPPVYQRLSNRDNQYSELVSRIQGLILIAKYREASAAISAGFSAYNEDAMLYFLRGKVQAAEGAYSDALTSFITAKDLDPVPWRALSQLNSIVRRAATGKSGVYLIDLEKVYQERAEHGLVGLDLIADNVHGTPLGESISAHAIIEAMFQIGFLPRPEKTRADCCPVAPFLAHVGYLQPKSALHLQFLLKNAKYVMKSPFLDFELGRKYLMDALDVDANSWEVWANLATVSYLTGQRAAGDRQIARATELYHGPLDSNDRVHTPYLKEAVEAALQAR